MENRRTFASSRPPEEMTVETREPEEPHEADEPYEGHRSNWSAARVGVALVVLVAVVGTGVAVVRSRTGSPVVDVPAVATPGGCGEQIYVHRSDDGHMYIGSPRPHPPMEVVAVPYAKIGGVLTTTTEQGWRGTLHILDRPTRDRLDHAERTAEFTTADGSRIDVTDIFDAIC